MFVYVCVPVPMGLCACLCECSIEAGRWPLFFSLFFLWPVFSIEARRWWLYLELRVAMEGRNGTGSAARELAHR